MWKSQWTLPAGQTHSGPEFLWGLFFLPAGVKEGVESTMVGRWTPDLGVGSQQQTWNEAWDLGQKLGQWTRPDGGRRLDGGFTADVL